MKELSLNTSRISQETGYWCGPATIQNALSIHGKFASELEISRKTEALEGNIGWDDQDGTDNIRQITQVLNEYLNAGYVTRQTPNDPMTRDQKTQFWSDITTSIDLGYGVAVNIVAPPSNYPRGKLGTANPTYGGGTVFHYILVIGYQIVNGVLYVKIADSGFWPWIYWITFDQLATLVTPKGYSAVVEDRSLDADPIIDFLKAYLAPVKSDLKDISAQLVLPWPQLGKQNLKDAVGSIRNAG